jgi:hypothetical protein
MTSTWNNFVGLISIVKIENDFILFYFMKLMHKLQVVTEVN